MNVQLLNAGWMTASAALWRQGEDPEQRQRVPVPVYLIETESERILVDTGLNPGAVADPGFYGEAPSMALFALEQEETLTEQVDLSTLTRVVLTHLHFDHAGGLAQLPAVVPIVIQRREWEAGGDPDAVARNYFQPLDYLESERDIVLVDGAHDLLGDGSIELLPTPGHTPGHQSVRVGERLILGADVGHFAATLDDLRFPAFGDDLAEQGRSAEWLRQLRDDGSRVMPGHDPEALRPGPIEV